MEKKNKKKKRVEKWIHVFSTAFLQKRIQQTRTEIELGSQILFLYKLYFKRHRQISCYKTITPNYRDI